VVAPARRQPEHRILCFGQPNDLGNQIDLSGNGVSDPGAFTLRRSGCSRTPAAAARLDFLLIDNNTLRA
jgi:hypothetical protein